MVQNDGAGRGAVVKRGCLNVSGDWILTLPWSMVAYPWSLMFGDAQVECRITQEGLFLVSVWTAFFPLFSL